MRDAGIIKIVKQRPIVVIFEKMLNNENIEDNIDLIINESKGLTREAPAVRPAHESPSFMGINDKLVAIDEAGQMSLVSEEVSQPKIPTVNNLLNEAIDIRVEVGILKVLIETKQPHEVLLTKVCELDERFTNFAYQITDK